MAREGGKDRGLFERPRGSGVWWVRYHDTEGQERREKVGAKSAARLLYQKRQAEKLQGQKLPELKRRKEVTLADLRDRFLGEIRSNKKDHATDERILGLWVERLGSEPARRITPGDIERIKTRWLEEGLANGTVNRRLACLKTLFGKAVRDNLCESNPLEKRRVKMLRESPPRERIVAPEEEAVLEARLPRSDWLAVMIALHTGLRISEQLERTREDVDLKRGILYIPEAKGGGRQEVQLNEVALSALKEMLSSHSHHWIFPDTTGKGPLSRSVLSHRFSATCRELELADMTWHALRHTFISRLVMLGIPLPTVQKLARHKSIQMTLRYSHLYPQQLREALGSLAAAYQPPGGSP